MRGGGFWTVVAVALAMTTAGGAARPLATAAQVTVVERQRIEVGPYPVEVGFSEWPVLAERSVDITFTPDGGIADKTATMVLVGPSVETDFWRGRGGFPLGRHPRDRERWGLDLIALPEAGAWTMRLTIDGPQGIGTGEFGPFAVGPRPGPPVGPMWAIGALPLLLLFWLLGRAWVQVRPGRTADARSWA